MSTRDQVDHLLGSNIRRLEEIVLGQIKARLKKPKPYEGFYIRLAFAVSKPNICEFRGFASSMILHSRRFAHAAVRELYRASKDRDEAWRLYLIAQTIFHNRWIDGWHVDKAEAKVIAPLIEEYRELMMPIEARQSGEKMIWEETGHLDFFDALTPIYRDVINFDNLSEYQREDFIDMAEELGRRYQVRKEKSK